MRCVVLLPLSSRFKGITELYPPLNSRPPTPEMHTWCLGDPQGLAGFGGGSQGSAGGSWCCSCGSTPNPSLLQPGDSRDSGKERHPGNFAKPDLGEAAKSNPGAAPAGRIPQRSQNTNSGCLSTPSLRLATSTATRCQIWTKNTKSKNPESSQGFGSALISG